MSENLDAAMTEMGPVLRAATPFVFASFEREDYLPYQTDAIRYWQARNSVRIFITHLRWKEGGEQHELSRCRIIDVWVHAFNLTQRVFATLERIEDCWAFTPEGDLQDEVEREGYSKMNVDVREIQGLQLYVSDFLAKLVYFEATGIARPHWYCSDLPELPDSISDYVDPALPANTQPFQIIRSLNRLITRVVSEHLPHFMVKLNYPLTDMVPPIRGEWRSRVQAMDDDVELNTVLDFGDERSTKPDWTRRRQNAEVQTQSPSQSSPLTQHVPSPSKEEGQLAELHADHTADAEANSAIVDSAHWPSLDDEREPLLDTSPVGSGGQDGLRRRLKRAMAGP